MQPCPLCIMQRYAYIAIAFFCLVGALFNVSKTGAGFGVLASLSGIGVAGRHLWVQAHPEVSCGLDPLEVMLNIPVTAKLWPDMFKADGMCTSGYDAILGLSVPQWSMVWFVLLTLVLCLVIFRRH